MAKQKVKEGYFDPSKEWGPFPAHEKERERAGFYDEQPTIKSQERVKKVEASLDEYLEFKKGLMYFSNDTDLLT